jgi:hypothetical protein
MVKLKDSKRVGKIGEDIVEKYFLDKEYTVEKLSIDDQLVKRYDYLVTKGEKQFKIEVKYDRSLDREKECCFETKIYLAENNFNSIPGWTQKYSALSKVLIMYVLPSTKQFLVIEAKRLKEINYRQFRSVSKDIHINCSMTAHYIPLSHLLNYGKLINW